MAGCNGGLQWRIAAMAGCTGKSSMAERLPQPKKICAKGPGMAFGETLTKLRKDKGITQEELAKKLFVTRQAVSRWENGETTPGIDMVKLIATVLEVPIACLMEMPDYPLCQSCGMPLTDASDRAMEADGSKSEVYCRHCYHKGEFTYDTDMDGLIEACAPFLVQHSGMSLDEAISIMGAMLPGLKRWHAVRENEERYGAEARARYGDEAVDATNARLLAMDEQTWNTKEELEQAILEQLMVAMEAGDPKGAEADKLCAMHERWIRMHWGDAAYSRAAHKGLAEGYLCDKRFVQYYDGQVGEGATEFLVSALRAYCEE